MKHALIGNFLTTALIWAGIITLLTTGHEAVLLWGFLACAAFGSGAGLIGTAIVFRNV